jgi:hypothetical protein
MNRPGRKKLPGRFSIPLTIVSDAAISLWHEAAPDRRLGVDRGGIRHDRLGPPSPRRRERAARVIHPGPSRFYLFFAAVPAPCAPLSAAPGRGSRPQKH